MKYPIVVKRITTLGSVWVVREIAQVCAGVSQQASKSPSGHPHWLVLRPEDVRFVRALDAQNLPSAVTAKCMTGASSQSGPVRARTRPNIAEYAQTLLNCDSGSFQDGSGVALVFKFGKGYPGSKSAIKGWERTELARGSFRVLQISSLTKPDLEGIGGLEVANKNPRTFLQGGAAGSGKTLWVLGFASVSGYESWNADLSENRAKAVLEYLKGFYPKSLDGRYRGLGANLFSGLGLSQEDSGEQVAVAFWCRDRIGARKRAVTDQRAAVL